jgi:hypothetical protein
MKTSDQERYLARLLVIKENLLGQHQPQVLNL